ncbi:MAG TPA: polysaccharide deacetylase family protein [Tepidisphaeraceae bacterium]
MNENAIRERTWLGDVYRRGRTGDGRYALTFDDGPLPGATDAILDHLKACGAPATFFVIGRLAEQWPDVVKRMHAEGHVVANHTWDHWRHAMWRGPWYWHRQIERTDAVIEKLIGRRPALFRPPLGVRTPVNTRVLRQTGHACVMWTRRSLDGVRTTAERIERRLVATAADGDVLVLHDGREPASRRDPTPTIDALPRVIAAFRQRGLRPAALDALLGVAAYR